MSIKFFKKVLPDADRLARIGGMHAVTSRLGSHLRDPQVWQFNRRAISGGVAVGLFVGWLPIPLQMLLAAFLAIRLHFNLPVSVLLVWISNPLTFPGFLYAGYRTGMILSGEKPHLLSDSGHQQWLVSHFHELWLPTIYGCIVLGAISALLGFILTRVLWRLATIRRWTLRRSIRRQSKDHTPN